MDAFVSIADVKRNIFRKDCTPSLADCAAWRSMAESGPPESVPRRRTRKPSVASLIKQAEKAGKNVTSITRDGTLILGEANAGDDATDVDRELAEFEARHEA
jgi:hypothetical protein